MKQNISLTINMFKAFQMNVVCATKSAFHHTILNILKKQLDFKIYSLTQLIFHKTNYL